LISGAICRGDAATQENRRAFAIDAYFSAAAQRLAALGS